MSWFENHYRCEECRRDWSDEWSCTCDDDCPTCGATHSPRDSDDLTLVIEEIGVKFAVMRSGDHAEGDPEYEMLVVFEHREDAQRYLERLVPGEPHPAQLDLLEQAA